MAGPEAAFGPFRFDSRRRQLRHEDTPVKLGARALAILEALLEKPGRLVPRAELYERAWPGRIVNEANLKVQISGLRRALAGQGNLIRAESSLGYRFVGEVSMTYISDTPVPATRRRYPPRNIDPPIGRDATIAGIIALLDQTRLVTILGPGGIGKTTVARAVASKLDHTYPEGIYFVELDRIATENLVYATVTDALDLPVEVAADIKHVLLALLGRRLLLILDSCEHVAERVALLVERILSETRDVHVLVTSRESLRIRSEVIARLDPLEFPQLSVKATAANIEHYSATRLFARTVRQTANDFPHDDAAAAAAAEICRRLDGIPLALELAASMVGALGIDEVRRGLYESLSLLRAGRRDTIPRHRSLAATIEWSYNLLPAVEQSVLRRLSIFAGPFTLGAAIHVAIDDAIDIATTRDAVVALTNKSLLNVNGQSTPVEYRLLDTMRAYVSRAEAPMQEADQAHQRHARYFLEQLESKDWDSYDTTAESARMRGYTAEVRAALDWAFPVMPDLAVKLVLAAERLWLELTSLAQGVPYLTLASRYAETNVQIGRDVKARILVALASAQIFVPRHERANLYENAWRAAQVAGDHFLELRALYGIIQHRLLTRQPAAPYIDAFALASNRIGDPVTRRLFLRISAFHDLELSNVESALNKFDKFLCDTAPIPRGRYLYFGGFDSLISCKVGFALTKHYMGYSDQARSLLASAVMEAENLGHLTTLYFVLGQGAIWANISSGDFQLANAYLQKLEDVASLYRPWHVVIDVFQALLLRDETGDLQTAEQLFTSSLQEPFMAKTGTLHPVMWLELADTRRQLGDIEGAETAAEQAMQQCLGEGDARLIGKYNPVFAKILIARNRPGDIEAAYDLFRHAIDLCRAHSIFIYECEAVVGLAELEMASGRLDEARLVVTELLSRLGDRERVLGIAHARTILEQLSLARLNDRSNVSNG